ncbi:MAG: Phosphoenolpyruvate-protein phosphotransferase [Candidatus Izimaplasma bacterium HR2]|nr:MAG: Phosphoenolpyruvate-protein phosphotransferase [Candidatus Izimaplasma bacterium HR2]
MKINGKPVSDGIAMYNVYKLNNQIISVNNDLISVIELEIKKFHKAIDESTIELDRLKDIASKRRELANLEVFSSHKLIVNDPLIINEVEEIIRKTRLNAASAYKNVIDKYILKFDTMKNEYMSERSNDITDIYQRVVGKLVNQNIDFNFVMTKEVILVAKDITPSMVLSLNTKLIKGIILENGGKTSHSSLMIKNLGIPLVIGVKENIDLLSSGDYIIMDGELGDIISSPTSDEIYDYIILQNKRKEEREFLAKFINKATITKDGSKIEILANINNDLEVELALKNGAEGIGLFRTEFMYLDTLDFPSEDELFNSYKKVLYAFPNKKVIIRTLDIGGDKIPKHIEFNKQDELRGLPLTLANKEVLKAQIKALLRSNKHGNLSIMFPMVGSIDSLKEAIQLVYISHYELTDSGIEVNVNYKLGIMVEEMDVVNDIESFAKEVDFFSIGTNDLLQSMYNIDRQNTDNTNDKLYLKPEFLKTIKKVINISHKAGISTSLCGEIACDIDVVPKLIKYGIDSLSMSPKKILKTRYLISNISNK